MKSKTYMNFFLILTILLCFSRTLYCESFQIPEDFTTIQEGINASFSGDTVIIGEGTFSGPGNRDLDFAGKSIAVISKQGPKLTVIDCQADSLSPHTGFFFHSGEDSFSIVQGLTIKNGYLIHKIYPYDCGGGILCYNSAPKIESCIITGNHAAGDGGGIAYTGSASTPLVIKGCTISYNTAKNGGGVHCSQSSVRGCVITGNTAANMGGGIYTDEDVSVSGCTIAQNSAYKGGGAYSYVFCVYDGCWFAGNDAQNYGGGLFYGNSGSMIRCLFWGNTASRGGGINGEVFGFLNVTNCTFSRNSSQKGGGLYFPGNGSKIVDAIFWDNSPDEINSSGGSNLSVTFSNVKNGFEGEGNINVFPAFIDPEHGNFHISSTSPCIDAGSPAIPVPSGGGIRIDMGAFEYFKGFTGQAKFSKRVIRVPSAIPTIQVAVDLAVDGDTVLVEQGTYSGLGNSNLDFMGKAIVVMSESGSAKTVIDCANSSRAVTFHLGEGANSKLIGFTIRNGSSFGGAGIFCDRSSPEIRQCVITGNSAKEQMGGGGILINQCSPIISRCTISSNSAQYGGGGIRCLGTSDSEATPVISGCVIYGNTSNYGAGICCDAYASPKITGSIISGNLSSSYGAGILSHKYSKPYITGSTVVSNEAKKQGSAIFCTDISTMLLTNCILWNNASNSINSNPSRCVITYSDIDTVWPGQGNISADPLFVAPESSDFHIQKQSPCIDSGAKIDFSEDIDSHSRPCGAEFDMGADEISYGEPRIYVTAASLTYSYFQGESPKIDTLIVVSSGGSVLNYAVLPGHAGWVHLSGRLRGNLNSADKVSLTISLDLKELAPGTYNDLILVASNDPVRPYFEIPVELIVIPRLYNGSIPVAP